ncbi:uncharacterized protein N7477_003206 [Penicillium maclennaniae]|uniref:uncharacterized protein n=1 Tax=Penicillium maclennaniae TaxID=1343394 RepID=UPI00254158E2|nr:uncharacterized protein N7477_003206 [Penicillium maclennaniae]KAJ5677573.1 hypothetical protein N7477_003206 [Penicillium maclennaniae]
MAALMSTQNGHASESAVKPNRRNEMSQARKSKGTIRWMTGLVLRLCIWYTILTPFLRCPSHIADLNDQSPSVCKPYLIARSHVEPYITPYYDTYAAPYVEHARPYVEVVNQKVYIPASKIAKSGYEKYGAPAMEKAQAYGAAQWKVHVTPRLEAVQDQAHQLYLAQCDPYVQRGKAVVSPYYQKAASAAQTAYWDHFVPFYTRSQPFIGKTYATGQNILTTHVMPGARSTWSSVVYFANSSLWPQMTGFYSEQVEPQLVRIGQRLASYREGKHLRAVVEDMDNTTFEESTSTTASSAKIEPQTSAVTATSTVLAPSAKPTLSSEEEAKQARERVDSDLQRWQDKFALAADKGVEDLEERIEEIVTALIASSAKSHGQSLSTALQAVAEQKLFVVKQHIKDLAQSLPDEDAPQEEKSASEQLVSEIRDSAIAVRDRAHILREWSISFDDELIRRVTAAINSTLEVLDNIRDLGLQEIGMRWAWMDGVTYKDWARYHALKAKLDDWRNEIREVGMNHKSVIEAKTVASDILASGMEVAEDTAKELIRLKDVGQWKLAAREVSDNFDTRTDAPPPRPKPVEEPEEPEEILDVEHDEAGDAISKSSGDDVAHEEDTSETNSKSASLTFGANLEDDDEVDDESILDDELQEAHHTSRPAFGVAAAEANSHQAPILDNDEQDVFEKVTSKAEDIYSDASSAFADSTAQAKILFSSIESAYSGAVKYATEEFESRIGAVWATPTPTGPLAQISFVASSRLSEGLSLASAQLAQVKQTAPATSSAALQPFLLDAQRRYYEAVGLAHDHYTAFVSTASEAVYGTPTPTPAPRVFQDLIQEAGSQYELASSLASANLAAVVASASSMISAADDGMSQSIIDDASSRYSAAISAASASLSLASASASSAIYGTTPGPLRSLSSQASENWESLVAKASEQIYGTPVPYLQQVAAGSLSQFAAVQDVVSELLVGKQPSFTESVMSKLRVAYETPYPAAALSSASSYVSEAYETASSAANTYASSIPSVEDVMQNANYQLHAAVEAASIGIYGTPKGPYEKATDAAANAYSTASAQVSSAVYGQEPGYIDAAKDAIADIQFKASAAIYGDEPGAVESATARLAAAVQSAQARLADLASSASSVASEAAETASSHVGHAASSINSAASSVRDEL